MDSLDQYSSKLSPLPDKYAHVRSKVITVRLANPWMSAEVLAARRKCRSAERRWRDCIKKGT